MHTYIYILHTYINYFYFHRSKAFKCRQRNRSLEAKPRSTSCQTSWNFGGKSDQAEYWSWKSKLGISHHDQRLPRAAWIQSSPGRRRLDRLENMPLKNRTISSRHCMFLVFNFTKKKNDVINFFSWLWKIVFTLKVQMYTAKCIYGRA